MAKRKKKKNKGINVTKEKHNARPRKIMISVFLFFGEISHADENKKKNPGESNTGLLGNFLKENRHILRKKKLEVARFRQCVSTCPPGQFVIYC